MKYYTSYELEWEILPEQITPDKSDEAIGDYITNNNNMRLALDCYGYTRISAKWYNNESNMRAMSLRFPDVLFTLSGAGEEASDLWKKYFLNGKCQIAKAIITYDDFDAAKLR